MKEASSVKTSTPKQSKIALKQPRAFASAVAILLVLAVGFWWRKQHAAPPALQPGQTEEKKEMNTVPLDAEGDYVNQMIPEHQEAIDASKYILENSENDNLKQFAQNTITKQSKQVWALLGFYQLWYKKPYPGAPEYIKMMPDLTQFSGTELDKAYMRGMIDNHQQTVRQSQAVIRESNKDELKTLANDIVNTQVSELIQLNNWLKEMN